MIAITGVSGLVGGNLARELIARGQFVRGIIHQDRQAVAGLEMELVQADLLDLPSLAGAFKGMDVVYHLAGLISLSEQDEARMRATNIDGVQNVIAACRVSKVRRLVHFSSIHALEQYPLDVPVDEERPLALASRYGPYERTKAAGEELVRQALREGLDGVILNPSAIVGPFDFRPSYFGQALILMAKGSLPVLVRGGYDWVDVRDVVNAAIQAAQSAPSGSRFLLSGHWCSVSQVAQLVARLAGTKPPRLTLPLEIASLAAPLMTFYARIAKNHPLYTRTSLSALRSNRQVSHARASEKLGYQPRAFEETVYDTLAWFAKNGYFPIHPDHPFNR